jgi:acyl carrier protein
MNNLNGDIMEFFKNIFALNDDIVVRPTSRLSDYDIESLLFVQFMVDIENKYSIELSDGDFDKASFGTIQDMIDLIMKQIQEG